MKKKAVAPGIYLREDGKYSYRPWVRGRRTERILKATNARAAIRELAGKVEAKAESDIETLAKTYLEAGAPDKRGKPRPDKFVAAEKKRVENLLLFFGGCLPSEVKIKLCLDYFAWRKRRLNHSGTGERTVDMELATLSNVLHYAVLIEEADVNRIAHGRPRFRTKSQIRHCRECCPRSGDELHELANYLFEVSWGRSQATAWQMLFEALSGCRTGEALQMRWDAEPGKPGFIREGKWLYIHRLKQREGDVSDCIEISPELRLLLDAMKAWRDWRFPGSPWFFPSYQLGGKFGLHKDTLHRALYKVVPSVLGKERPITSHGMRAFFVTWQRARGVNDNLIAEMIGHRSGGATLIWNVYGRKLPPWATENFNPHPKTVTPLWEGWKKSTSDSTSSKKSGEARRSD